MNMTNKLVRWFSGGALVGLFIACLAVPPFLSWYNSPGDGTSMCDCTTCTSSATSKLLFGQTVGAFSLGLIALGLGVVVELRRRKKAETTAA